ncbi:hypothetical protein C8A00DRAFT_34217 [Chaetomidium leptoderma]|uniref:Ribosome biogenesis protein ALB1 n=1 Tax=Chaetomidium leptoderma TaxID=669021 RepID=A0AAN6ZV26_9PEZI|nr:hypothetical protein C8A00DRAFT_34217 [Chaetomidium leptoderma]
MPSRKNPNAPSKNRLAARAGKQRKTRQQAAAQGQLAIKGGAIAKADARRGARPGLLPTSGPRRAISKKRQRKNEKMLGHALRRKMEKEGEVVMKDAPVEKEKDKKKEGGDAEAEMDIE